MTECNYREMQLPFETVPFKEMNRKQAVQYLNWYIEVLDERIAYLANHVHETGGDVIFDYSPESLDPLWEWFMPRVKLVPMSEERRKEEMKGIKPWMVKYMPELGLEISSYTWRVMYDITAYCGQVVVKNIPELHWGCLSRPKSLVGLNEPCLLGFPHKMRYYVWNAVDICRQNRLEDPNAEGISRIYRVCKEMMEE